MRATNRNEVTHAETRRQATELQMERRNKWKKEQNQREEVKKNAGGKNSNSYLKIKTVQTLQAAAKQEIYNFPCKEITNTETRSFFSHQQWQDKNSLNL